MPPETLRNWTNVEVERFWNYWSRRTDAHPQYFSYQVGGEVVKFAELFGILRGRVIDYGCGPGFLLSHLLTRPDLEVYGFDTSVKSVAVCNDAYSAFPNFKSVSAGIVMDGTGEKFDTLFCTEVLEHCDDSYLAIVLSNVERLLRPGGNAVVTVPNNEMLAKNLIYCPFCDTEYHQVQHQRSFTKISLRATLERHGFHVDWCEELDFSLLKPRTKKRVTDVSMYDLYSAAKAGLERHVFPKKSPTERARVAQKVGGPHLAAVISSRVEP